MLEGPAPSMLQSGRSKIESPKPKEKPLFSTSCTSPLGRLGFLLVGTVFVLLASFSGAECFAQLSKSNCSNFLRDSLAFLGAASAGTGGSAEASSLADAGSSAEAFSALDAGRLADDSLISGDGRFAEGCSPSSDVFLVKPIQVPAAHLTSQMDQLIGLCWLECL